KPSALKKSGICTRQMMLAGCWLASNKSLSSTPANHASTGCCQCLLAVRLPGSSMGRLGAAHSLFLKPVNWSSCLLRFVAPLYHASLTFLFSPRCRYHPHAQQASEPGRLGA